MSAQSTANSELVTKFINARKLLSEESIDLQNSTEIREDEDQSVKLQETIDILVAAGYFRARIKGLSAFDKMVGGMVWCIESCNVDLDVGFLFRENLSIGKKIALTEKIVAILPKLKCPITIEPHQIQGLDFKNMFPVIQWLVKRSLECRQEMASFVRSYAVDQFNKKFSIHDKNHEKHFAFMENLNLVSEYYRPHRYYKKNISVPLDTSTQLHTTLLEYGCGDSSLQDNISLAKQLPNEHKIDLSKEHCENLNKHYTSLHLELKDVGSKSRDKILISNLEEKKQMFSEKCTEFKDEHESLDSEIKNIESVLQDLRHKQRTAEEALKELNLEEVEALKTKEIEDLIILSDDLKNQEAQYKEHCRKELNDLNKLIERTKIAKSKSPVEACSDLTEDINGKLKLIRTSRIKLAKVNREVALLQRQVDDIPKRAELAQYQKRFVELYNQVAIKHKETKQYYTLYNTLEDTCFWMKKELSLLNSISENYPDALISVKSKDEFLDQFQNIIDNVCSSKLKAEQKLDKEKQTRDQLSDNLHALVEQQRKYVTCVKQLGVECRKQEMLIKNFEQKKYAA